MKVITLNGYTTGIDISKVRRYSYLEHDLGPVPKVSYMLTLHYLDGQEDTISYVDVDTIRRVENEFEDVVARRVSAINR